MHAAEETEERIHSAAPRIFKGILSSILLCGLFFFLKFELHTLTVLVRNDPTDLKCSRTHSQLGGDFLRSVVPIR